MTVLPVISRELRASARQPFTYYVRVLGAMALLAASALFGLKFGFEPSMGRVLFSSLHGTLFVAIWLLVPMLTADCISRERREGTLGLLFLTPLKGVDIVSAKGVAHGLRAVTLGLAVLPILTVSFLLGGVSWGKTLASVAINADAMCLALAAGLLASTWSKSWLRALLLAAILAFAFLMVLTWGIGSALLEAARRAPAIASDREVSALGIGFATLASGDTDWSFFMIRTLPAREIPWVIVQVTLLSACMLLLAVMVASRNIRHSWQEEPPSPRQLWWRQTFCTPVLWLRYFRRWMRRKLERNPIGWLEQRTWSGRLVTWAWFAIMISIYSSVLADRSFLAGSSDIQETLAWLLAGSIAMSAAGSFRRERESGVLELLLVSPLGEKQIIAGRLGGLWSQFAPAAVLLLAIWAYFSTFLPSAGQSKPFIFFIMAFLTMPVFGLYFSLRCRNFLSAFVFAVAIGLLLPLVLAEVLRWLWWRTIYGPLYYMNFEWAMAPNVLSAACQGILAVFFWDRMCSRLRRRAFPLQRADG